MAFRYLTSKDWKILTESCSSTCIFVGLVIAFVYYSVNSRTSVLFKTVFIGYQTDDVIAIIMEETPFVTFSVGECRWSN